MPVDGQDWSTDPFKPEVRDGKLFGRGACDMKGFVGVALSLAPEIARAKLTRPMHFALSYDEEVGCVGVTVFWKICATEASSRRWPSSASPR